MSNKPTTLDDTMQFRCRREEKRDFVNHCRLKLKRPAQDVMREIMVALPDGRLSIKPTDEQKQATKELYTDEH